MKHELRLYCEKTKLSDLRDFLDQELSSAKLTDILKNELVLAVEEVCANRIIHTHGCNPASHLHVKVLKQEDRIIFEITDSGEPFDILDYKTPDLKEVIKGRQKSKAGGGVGILLVKRIMDTIEIETQQSRYLVRLTKQLNSK
ncbi:ATP-binding protein [Echinicola strongylocentroti]|uniref:ATP-binding protein n=1 Tax=Echinicola strongylocentroti TaxID=1795355 RepID=A0A2Z4II23_9BACT|nr:ATP-binding protein [Echinicola strongylocentroti]AWW30340.1 ATP-binding protein [Echinicola strongylocentroti]